LLNAKNLKMKKNKNSTIIKLKSTLIFKNKTVSTMKKLLILLFTCLFFVPVKGQINNQPAAKTQFKQKVLLQPYVPRDISLKQFLENKEDLDLLENNKLIEVFRKTSNNGNTNSKIIQTVCDIPVEGSMFVTIEENNTLKMNAKFVPGLDLNTKTSLTEAAYHTIISKIRRFAR